MLTRPRLRVFDARSLGDRARHAALAATVGHVPAALHVLEPKTRLDRRAYSRLLHLARRPSEAWARPELELFAAFVSVRNHCRY